ncbi:hypothetical protein BLNAU_22159 [Blattamonas nauphoetae]|uniref:Uncharacterized protein n=1 Tax=Blattamonas nauphoetae TaxID=2049346 RepID=A0ABQ9WUF7_9EUKA|nr:hypothetical protein BLNAU_22159 [Blattamonas nauphoetae]
MLKRSRFYQKKFISQNVTVSGELANSENKIEKTKSKYNLKYNLLSDTEHPVKVLWGIKLKGTHEEVKTTFWRDLSGVTHVHSIKQPFGSIRLSTDILWKFVKERKERVSKNADD